VQLNVNKLQHVLVVSVNGRLDTNTADDFQTSVNEILTSGEKAILVDLEKVDYVSTAGLRALLMLAKKASALGGKAHCCGLQPLVKKIFDVSEFSRLIAIYDSVQDALTRI